MSILPLHCSSSSLLSVPAARRRHLLFAVGQHGSTVIPSAPLHGHTRGVFHRDLKLENLLVDENGDLKVSDFGLSAIADQFHPDGLLHTFCGTPSYVAPVTKDLPQLVAPEQGAPLACPPPQPRRTAVVPAATGPQRTGGVQTSEARRDAISSCNFRARWSAPTTAKQASAYFSLASM
ncbi:hypothetical protein GUJ93_ZPchr0001g30475 [Zizania palustris]|uniref:Protein kinase domain-containing protein n=1 Tax=Zizania palustris TaxID=103762 RepID=A0A8J5SD09_ZIZPA|nr:hypothetical protein GUJ93_ZPchr0001g30475 [Zizania palustris]